MRMRQRKEVQILLQNKMKLIEFPEQTVVIAKNQPEYLPMPAHVAKDQGMTTTVCWKLSWMERISVLFGGVIWHQMLTFGEPMQPQMLQTFKPDLP